MVAGVPVVWIRVLAAYRRDAKWRYGWPPLGPVFAPSVSHGIA